MKFAPDYIANLAPYKVASHRIWEGMDQQRHLKLDWNEATISASPQVAEAVQRCIANIGFRYYPDVSNQRLLEQLALYTALEQDYLQYFASSDAAHEYLARVTLEPGDKVLLLGPTYDNVRLTCQAAGAEIHYHFYDEAFRFSRSAYQQSLRQHRPKLAYICNPNNPTGTLIEPEMLATLFAEHPETLFLVDEAYYEYAGKSCAPLVQQFDNLVVTRTFSKAFALANFRIGYLMAAPAIIKTLNKVRNPKNICSFAQEAAIAALKDSSYTTDYVAQVNAAKQFFAAEVERLIADRKTLYVGEGNYLLIRFHDELEKNYFVGALARGQVYIRDLSHVSSLQNYVRITIGTQEQMAYVASLIEKMYAE